MIVLIMVKTGLFVRAFTSNFITSDDPDILDTWCEGRKLHFIRKFH